MSDKTVLIFGSYAPSLVHFRGSLISTIAERGHKVFAAAPGIPKEIDDQLKELGAEPRQLPLVNAGMSPLGMWSSFAPNPSARS